MIYNNFGRVVFAIVIILCVVFLRSPRKSFFVYPFSHPRGKLFFSKTLIWVITLVLVVLRSFDIQRKD